MKKYIAIIIILLNIFGVASCSSSKKEITKIDCYSINEAWEKTNIVAMIEGKDDLKTMTDFLDTAKKIEYPLETGLADGFLSVTYSDKSVEEWYIFCRMDLYMIAKTEDKATWYTPAVPFNTINSLIASNQVELPK